MHFFRCKTRQKRKRKIHKEEGINHSLRYKWEKKVEYSLYSQLCKSGSFGTSRKNESISRKRRLWCCGSLVVKKCSLTNFTNLRPQTDDSQRKKRKHRERRHKRGSLAVREHRKENKQSSPSLPTDKYLAPENVPSVAAAAKEKGRKTGATVFARHTLAAAC